MAKKKRTSDYLHNITHKTKDRVKRTPLKTRDELSSVCFLYIHKGNNKIIDERKKNSLR